MGISGARARTDLETRLEASPRISRFRSPVPRAHLNLASRWARGIVFGQRKPALTFSLMTGHPVQKPAPLEIGS